MTFLKELMRRNVIKVGTVYVIVGWLLIQGASILLPAFQAPDWSEPVFYALIIAGLPIALILAWAFELTPQGVKRTEALVPRAPEDGQADVAPKPAIDSEVPSIAVLPFADMSPDKDQEYFSDGLSEELLNKLARLNGLQVAGRTSSFHFKGRNEDIRSIGEALGVANVLEGSVRKSGEMLRITAQLIDARNGYHLWSETYDRKLDDIFAIQDDIAEGVAKALAVTLAVGDLGQVEGMTRSVEAYEAYLVGRPLYTGRLSQDRFRELMTALERAVRLDPSFALAWARLATQYSLYTRYEGIDQTAGWQQKADDAQKRALELAPNAAEVLSQSAVTAMGQGNWIETERIYRQAVDRHGEASVAYLYSFFLLTTGRISKAIDLLIEARRIEPLDVATAILLGVAYDSAGEASAALAEGDRCETFGEPESQARGLSLMVAMASGDRGEIMRRLDSVIEVDDFTGPMHEVVRPLLDDVPAALAELRKLYTDPSLSSPQHGLVIACWANFFGDPELALSAWWRIFDGGRIITLGDAIWMSCFRDMRRLPGFKDLLREIGLVDYWRTTGDWGDFCHPVGDDDFECR